MMICFPHVALRRLLLVVFLGISLALPSMAAGAEPDDPASAAALARFDAALAQGNEVDAVRSLLEYAEENHGENAPQTATLTHRYGYVLMRAGRYPEAVKALELALERSEAAFGEFGGEAYDINMNIGIAYSHHRPLLKPRIEHFDRALEVLRARGERETVKYVTTLISIVGNLADQNGLSGETSTRVDGATTPVMGTFAVRDTNIGSIRLSYSYKNLFYKTDKYLEEAVELAEKLVHVDEYLPAKVAVVQARMNFLETADLVGVAPGISGRITKKSGRRRNEQEEKRLADAILSLSKDPVVNESVLVAANKALLDIAWLDNDMSRMAAMCARGNLNSERDYPSDRLFRLADDGSIIDPAFSSFVSSNIFRNTRRGRAPPKDEHGKRITRPYYIPACINGELMAALINAPRVIIEEYR